MDARWIDRWDGPLLRGSLSRPEPGSNEVLIEVEACGVGLTVLNCIRGDLSRGVATTPRVPGHEYVGRIVEVGPGVPPDRIGERVMAYFYLFCGRCHNCLAGHESICENLAGYVGVDRDGGYANFATLPARNALPVPDDLDPVDATAVPDAIATPVHVANRARIEPNDRVVVIGAGGGVGIHMVQVAALHGANVLGLEPSAAKREFMESELGVAAADSSSFSSLEMPDQWKDGVDVVIDLLGREESLSWAIRALREGGRLAVLTTFPGVEIPLSPRDLVFRQLDLLGSRYASRSELLLAADLVANGSIRAIVSERSGFDDVDVLHERLVAGELLGRGALVWD
jgi:propanol-preferring alcohol dehydrogenase